MKLKLNEITSSLTHDDVIKNMLKRYQGFSDPDETSEALEYTLSSREHARKKVEAELMTNLKDGRSVMKGDLVGSYQAEADGIPVLISTPFYYSFKKAPAFTSVFAEDSKLYMRAQLLLWATEKEHCIVAQWSALQSLIETVNYDPAYVKNIALPYLDKLITEFNEKKDTPLFVVRDDLQPTIDLIEELDAQIEVLTDMRKEQLEILQEATDGINLKIGDREFRYIERKGSIDYARYSKENGLDLEEYRKKGSGSWRLF